MGAPAFVACHGTRSTHDTVDACSHRSQNTRGVAVGTGIVVGVTTGRLVGVAVGTLVLAGRGALATVGATVFVGTDVMVDTSGGAAGSHACTSRAAYAPPHQLPPRM